MRYNDRCAANERRGMGLDLQILQALRAKIEAAMPLMDEVEIA